MADLSYPGVYIDEVSSGVRPLERAGTSTAAFVGVTQMGPEGATRVTNWTEFQRTYGQYVRGSLLPQSVFQYFNNGGRQCYIVRGTRAGAKKANVTVQSRATSRAPAVTFSAKSAGTWGNYLYLQIEDGGSDPGNEFKVSVRRQEEVDLVPEDFRDTPALEVFDDLSCHPTSPRFVTEVLKHQSSLIDATVHVLADFPNGVHLGGIDPTAPDGANRGFMISLDGDGFQKVEYAAAVDGTTDDLSSIATKITAAVTNLTPNKNSNKDAFAHFECKVVTVGNETRLQLTSGSEKAASTVRIAPAETNDATDALRIGPRHGTSFDGISVQRPAKVDSVQLGDAVKEAPVLDQQLGTDGDSEQPMSSAELTNALHALDNITDASLLAVPGEATAAVMNAAMGYCSTRPLQDMFYIGETPIYVDNEAEVLSFRGELTAPNSYGALYFPWIVAQDLSGLSRDPVLLPPSGYVAGLYARIDAARGVWKAPAGVEATLNGVVGLTADLNDIQHGNLNKQGVCALRRFPTAGVVAFGARTISSNPEWKYIPVRRMAIMLRVSIYYGIQWAVFEPNDEPLWSQLRLNIGSFMTTLFRQGAFQGSTTSEAFFVKCDSETTQRPDIANGVVNVLIGFAPLKPAEFVVVKISQKAGSVSS